MVAVLLMSNFSFLDGKWMESGKFGRKAEESYLYGDPTAVLFHLRTFLEKLTKLLIDLSGNEIDNKELNLNERIILLERQGTLPKVIANKFHKLRMDANIVVHEGGENLAEPIDALEALNYIKLAYSIAVWSYQEFDFAGFEAQPFFIPKGQTDHIQSQPNNESIESKYSKLEINQAEKENIEDTEKNMIRETAYHRLSNQGKKFSCVGIDSCKKGWMVVNITHTSFEIGIFETIEEVYKEYKDSNSLIIDIPIGLPEDKIQEEMRPDPSARHILGSRGCTVFNAPCRQAVYNDTYEQASQANREIMEKGLSKQSFAICPKIKEVDLFLEKAPHFKNRLLESHPEVCFAKLNSNQPIMDSKGTKEGQEKRIAVLEQHYDKTKDLIDYANRNQQYRRYLVDIIDALCMAVIGIVALENGIKSIPESPKTDNRGIPMQMVYAVD